MAYRESLDHMLAAWNEQDPERVRGHLDKALAPDVKFIDPSVETHGIDEFEVNVRTVQATLPGARYSRTSGVDSHRGRRPRKGHASAGVLWSTPRR